MADNTDAMSSDYSAAQIKKTVWGRISQAANGAWETTWELEMDSPMVGDVVYPIHHDEESGFDAQLVVLSRGRANLVMSTTGHAMLAHYYPLTFMSFRLVNDNIGAIKTIQGLPRDWYAPFRSRPM